VRQRELSTDRVLVVREGIYMKGRSLLKPGNGMKRAPTTEVVPDAHGCKDRCRLTDRA